MSAPVLAVEDLRTEFPSRSGPVRAVDGVSFELQPRQVLALLGESGSGKSTTGLSILRLVPPPGAITGGSVRYGGKELLALPEREMRELRGRCLAMVFQNPRDRADPVFTIDSQLVEILRLHGLASGRNEARRRAVELLEEVRVDDPERVLRLYPHELSGGMLQRVMIAAAVSSSPEVLIADEPTSALDVTIQSDILALLGNLRERRGMTMVFITHDVRVARQMADVVAVMYAGQIVEYGTAEDVLERPLHPYTRGLLACVPDGARENGRLRPIGGQPIDLRRLPAGCRFAPRCPFVRDDCLPAVPKLVPVEGRLVRCVLYGEES
jgi:oligopeptide/dipeptide ABC transporter ATP-binding protein